MKQTLIILSIFLVFLLEVIAQNIRPYDAYLIEENTYITNPVYTDNGLFFSDNYYSAIYKYDGNQTTVVHQSPGCGRYIQVSPDFSKIGFKIIDENGMQTPAIYNITNGSLQKLHSPSEQCGQVFFTSDGDIYFSVNENVLIISGGQSTTVNIGEKCNYIAYSKSTGSIVFSDFNDQLYALDISTLRKTTLTNGQQGYTYPAFSPDGKKLSFNSIGSELYLMDFISGETVLVDYGGGVKWLDNNSFTYVQYNNDDENIARADIKIYKNGQIKNLTETKNVSEMQPFPAGNNRIAYHTYDKRSVYVLNYLTGAKQVIYHTDNALPVKFFEIKSSKADILVSGTVPYIHQVYDTPTWHYGYSSCAPTTSAMALAYYNQLPPWPVSVSHGYSWDPHINNYGSYVADRYRFNEFYYDISATTGGTTAYGGYGFMWGSKSPNGMMRTYHEQHYHTSNQLWTTSCTFAATTTEINLGYVHPICNYLTTSGHLTLAKGYVQGQQTLIFNDPYGNKNTPGYPSYDGAGAKYDWPGANNGYVNLDADGSHGYVAWTVRARYSPLTTYNDTIIDNNYYGHGFYVNNTQAGSHQRYFRDFNVGYNGHTWYTMTDAGIPDICWVTWTPNLPQSGAYEVFAHIPSNGATAHDAPYKIYHDNGMSTVVVNQNIYSNQWISLGTYTFTQGAGGHVYLGDSTSTDGEMIAYDAVWWSYRPAAVADFSPLTSEICQGESITFNNQSTNATSYSWQFSGGTPSTSTNPSPTITYNTAGTYNVILIATGQWSSDTLTAINTITVNNVPVAGFSAQNTSLSLPNAIALFTNESQYSQQYIWDFGDGGNSTDPNPYHQYNAEGYFTVSLIATSSDCGNDTIIHENYIYVNDPTLIISEENENYVYYHSGKIYYNTKAEKQNLTIYSSQGKAIKKYNLISPKGTIPITNLPNGIYICAFTDLDTGFTELFKFFHY